MRGFSIYLLSCMLSIFVLPQNASAQGQCNFSQYKKVRKATNSGIYKKGVIIVDQAEILSAPIANSQTCGKFQFGEVFRYSVKTYGSGYKMLFRTLKAGNKKNEPVGFAHKSIFLSGTTMPIRNKESGTYEKVLLRNAPTRQKSEGMDVPIYDSPGPNGTILHREGLLSHYYAFDKRCYDNRNGQLVQASKCEDRSDQSPYSNTYLAGPASDWSMESCIVKEGNRIKTKCLDGWILEINTFNWPTRLAIEPIKENLDTTLLPSAVQIAQGRESVQFLKTNHPSKRAPVLYFETKDAINNLLRQRGPADIRAVEFSEKPFDVKTFRFPILLDRKGAYPRPSPKARKSYPKLRKIGKEAKYLPIGYVADNEEGAKTGEVDKYVDDLSNRLQQAKDERDVLFIIDATSSMQPYFSAVKNAVSALMQQMNEMGSNLKYRFAIAFYRDRSEGSKMTEYFNFQDMAGVNSVLSKASAYSNSSDRDAEEALFKGVRNGLKEANSNWRNFAFKAAIIIGDAGGNDRSSSIIREITDARVVSRKIPESRFKQYHDFVNLFAIQVRPGNTQASARAKYETHTKELLRKTSDVLVKVIEKQWHAPRHAELRRKMTEAARGISSHMGSWFLSTSQANDIGDTITGVRKHIESANNIASEANEQSLKRYKGQEPISLEEMKEQSPYGVMASIMSYNQVPEVNKRLRRFSNEGYVLTHDPHTGQPYFRTMVLMEFDSLGAVVRFLSSIIYVADSIKHSMGESFLSMTEKSIDRNMYNRIQAELKRPKQNNLAAWFRVVAGIDAKSNCLLSYDFDMLDRMFSDRASEEEAELATALYNDLQRKYEILNHYLQKHEVKYRVHKNDTIGLQQVQLMKIRYEKGWCDVSVPGGKKRCQTMGKTTLNELTFKAHPYATSQIWIPRDILP